MALLQNALETLAGTTDFYSIALPFVLVFAIIYGLLSKLRLFGEKSEQVNAIIGLAGALYAIQFGGMMRLAGALPTMMGATSVLLIILLLAMVGAALFGVTPDTQPKWFGRAGGALGLGLLALLLFTFGGFGMITGGASIGLPAIGLMAVDVVTLTVLGLGGGAIAYMVRG